MPVFSYLWKLPIGYHIDDKIGRTLIVVVAHKIRLEFANTQPKAKMTVKTRIEFKKGKSEGNRAAIASRIIKILGVQEAHDLDLRLGASLVCSLVLGFVLVTASGCSTIKTQHFSNPALQFAPFPEEIIPAEEVSEIDSSPLGFITPLQFKESFDWPVDQARLTRGFLPNARPRPHLGLDLADRKGTPVLAANDGYVIYAGSGFRGYGRFIIIEHEGEWASFYGHLDKILIKQGTFIHKGDLIGQMGRTGRATGTHLHFELRHDRKAIDPIAFLPQETHASNN